MQKKINLDLARLRLIIVWLVGGGLLLAPLIYQTISRTFEKTTETGVESFAQEVWGWFVPMLFPTLTLMLGTLAINTSEGSGSKLSVRKSTYTICLLLSVLYILLLFLHVFFWPAFKYENPMKLFNTANFYLGPFQAAVVLLIGMLFNRSDS